MDNFIYILIAIFWVAFTIYRQAQKNQQQPQTDEKIPEQQQATTFDEVIQEILRPRTIKPIATADISMKENLYAADDDTLSLEDQTVPDTIDSEAQPIEGSNSLETAVEYKGYSPLAAMEETEQEEVYAESILDGFDPRKAIIYSIILNRSYS